MFPFAGAGRFRFGLDETCAAGLTPPGLFKKASQKILKQHQRTNLI